MNQYLSEIHEKYTKIAKSAILIGFLNRLVFPLNLTDSQPLDKRIFKLTATSLETSCHACCVNL